MEAIFWDEEWCSFPAKNVVIREHIVGLKGVYRWLQHHTDKENHLLMYQETCSATSAVCKDQALLLNKIHIPKLTCPSRFSGVLELWKL